VQLNCGITEASPGWRRARTSGTGAGDELRQLQTRAVRKVRTGEFPQQSLPSTVRVFMKTPATPAV